MRETEDGLRSRNGTDLQMLRTQKKKAKWGKSIF